jgi:hypothetical protein
MQHDIGAYIRHELAYNVRVQDASSTDDGQAVGGVVLDRQALGEHYLSCKPVVEVRFRGSTTRNATVDVKIQDGASSNTFADYSSADWPATKTIGATGATGAQILNEIMQFDVDLAAARRYVRIAITGNHAATSSGTSGLEDLTLTGVITFGGAGQLPAD